MTDELVRDGIPTILKEAGLNPNYEILPKTNMMRKQHARNKFVHVSGELQLALKMGKPEEILSSLAKVMDIVGLLASEHKMTMKQVREARDSLRALKGQYENFTILKGL